MEGSIVMGGTRIAGWFVRENPNLKWMIWGYPVLRNLYIGTKNRGGLKNKSCDICDSYDSLPIKKRRFPLFCVDLF